MLAAELTRSEASCRTPDDNLITAAKQGDVEAFGALFERHKDAVYAFILKSIARREDAEDIVQETFCRAWRSIARFRGDAKLLTWLFRIAANLCADYGRSSERRTCSATEAGMDSEGLERAQQPRGSTETDNITRQLVKEALQSLHVNHRMLVILCDIHGFTHTEAAEILGCSPVSARVRLFRARRTLRRSLSQALDKVD